MGLSRRDFLKGVLAGLFGAFLTWVGVVKVEEEEEKTPSCELGYIECPTVSMNVSPASTYLARKEIDDLRQGLVAWWPPPEPGALYKPVDDWAFWEKPDGCVETTWRFPFGNQSFLSEDDKEVLDEDD
jgi:hypothetical protein